ncbi:unnamed protein product [Candidula unifasciata]|uniref:G-protein coupled receptors family 1 profile domain-containing protein n=1 Tax=Candidula unifasciata TaxID=100452 RepID=A0A8S3YXH2_9EUPU|nr:unnamed protein product [Candidula unifasciata]
MAAANATSPALLVSWELYDTILFTIDLVILPCISVLGIAGNVTGIIALAREGFRKCSNVLLFSLSISNLIYLIGVNKIFEYIYTSRNPSGFYFSEAVNYTCYILYLVWGLLSSLGGLTCPLIPLLITVERILVIFYPFKAFLILTPRRIIILLICVYVLLTIYMLGTLLTIIQLKTYVIKNVSKAVIVRSDLLRNPIIDDLFTFLRDLTNYLTGIIPLSLITVGCGIIGLKIIHVTKRRQKLTSKQIKANTKHGITKTTKTLLKICLLYILCYGNMFFLMLVVDSELLKNERPLQNVLIRVQDLIISINCLGDVLIYIASNKSYWKSLTVCA